MAAASIPGSGVSVTRGASLAAVPTALCLNDACLQHRHLSALLAAPWLTDHDKGLLLRPLGQLIKLQQLYHHDLVQQLDSAHKEQTCVGQVCLKHAMEVRAHWQHVTKAMLAWITLP